MIPSAQQPNSEHEIRCIHARRCLIARSLVSDVPQDFLRVSGSSQDPIWSDVCRAMPSLVNNLNQCILIAGTLVLRKAGARLPSIMSNVSNGGTETNDQALLEATDAAASLSDTDTNTAVFLHTKISNLLPRDSLASAVRKGLETLVGSGPSLHPWSEGDNGLLLYNN